jgi:S-adenosylhomocysteine hydrolase
VLDSLRQSGIRVTNAIFNTTTSEPYDTVLTKAVAAAMARVQADLQSGSSRGLLVIDDGGHALAETQHLIRADLSIKAVEQTTRGIRLAAALPPRFCIVNIGRSQAKLELEAPLIAESMVQKFKKSLTLGSHLFGEQRDILLMGYGAVGQQVAYLLRKENYNVTVFDTAAEIRRTAVAQGFSVVESLETAFEKSCVVAASTGSTSFPAARHELLKSNSVLANMGSSDLEFAAWELREGNHVRSVYDLNGRELRLSGREAPWRKHYMLNHQRGHLYLMKGGFPVDFDGEPDPIPPTAIQLTRALLLAGALQAARETRKGLVDLDADVQRQIMEEYARLTAAFGNA